MCNWEALNFYNHGFITWNQIEDYFIGSNWMEPDGKFKSKFTYSEYDPNDITAFTVIISNDIQVVIMKFRDETLYDENIRYELYLIKDDGKVIPSCGSHKFDKYDYYAKELIEDEAIGDILAELYNEARNYCYYGKENHEKEMIYDEYLLEIPF